MAIWLNNHCHETLLFQEKYHAVVLTVQKMKFSIKEKIQFPTDVVTFTKEILDEKLHFLCSSTFEKLLLNELQSVSHDLTSFLYIKTQSWLLGSINEF